MRPHLTRWALPGLLLVWAVSHAAVFGGDPKDAKGKADLTPIERVRHALDKPITLDFTGQSLQEALQHLQTKTGLDFQLDSLALDIMGVNPMMPDMNPIHLKSKGDKVSQVLRKVLTPHQLTYLIYEDSVLITSIDLATSRQLKQRVNLDVNEVPLHKALRDLGRSYAVNMVVDPKVSKDAQKPVTLQLESASLETTVRLLAEIAGLKAVRMDNVLFVTTEERAEKIRKEERELNPPDVGPDGMPIPRVPGRAAVSAQRGALIGAGLGALVGAAVQPVPVPQPQPPERESAPPPLKQP